VGASEKHLRDSALLNAMHPGTVPYREQELEQTDTPSFDSGVPGVAPAHRPDPTLRPLLQRRPYREPGGWYTLELEDGADLFFGHLGER
jgi:hypothetical protein